MTDSEEFGDFSYGRLRKWLHAPKALIRQTVKYNLLYFGACLIQHDINDQNIVNEAVKNLYSTKGMKPDSKLNIKKLPKLDLEISYAKIQIHTQPTTVLDLNQILFCEKTKVVGDTKGFHFLAFVVSVESENTAYIFVCSKEFANSIKQTFVQLHDMRLLHNNCNEIRNAIKQIGCAPETSKQICELWQAREKTFKDSIHSIQSEMNRRFGSLNESLEKLKSENIDKEALQEHIKMIEENLMKGLNIPSDRNESMCQKLHSYLNPQPAFKPSYNLSPMTSINFDNSYDDSTLKPATSSSYNSPSQLDNVYETPKQPSEAFLSIIGNMPQIPTTPVPQFPVAFRTLPTRKKSPIKDLFITPKPRTNLNKMNISDKTPTTSNPNQSVTLERNIGINKPSESTYYEGLINAPVIPTESTYYEGTINVSSKQSSEDDYYYCSTAENSTPKRSDIPIEVGSGSQSESSASQRNSMRMSNVFEDEEPDSVYITHQQFTL